MTDVVPFKGQYQEWCRVQLGFSHHDIWWVKGQQLKAGNLTLLLLAAVVGARKVLWEPPTPLPANAPIILSVFGGVVTLLGSLYVWDLFNTLVKSRKRANDILGLVHDPNGVLATQPNPRRHVVFPVVISLVEAVAWGVTLAYFGAAGCYLFIPPLAVWILVGVWGSTRPAPD